MNYVMKSNVVTLNNEDYITEINKRLMDKFKEYQESKLLRK